jgi:hypothetical protein
MIPKAQELQYIFVTKPDASKIKTIGEWFAGTGNQKGYYDGIGYSLRYLIYIYIMMKATEIDL